MAQWFEDDDLWRTLRCVLFTPEILAKAPAQIDGISTLIGLAPNSRILDLPCGVGRHSIELARRGHRVVAVDRTRAYLEEARASAAAAGVEIEFVLEDMRTFRRGSGGFDVVLNLWTSFGYWADPAEDDRVIGNFFAALRPGGTLLMETSSLEVVTKMFRDRDWRQLESGELFLEERRVVGDWSAIENRWVLIRGGEQKEIRFPLRLFTASSLKDLATRAGFVNVRCFGGLAGTPYDHKAERLVLVAEKPA